MARALPLPAGVRYGHSLCGSGAASGWSYRPDGGLPASKYEVEGGGEASHVRKQLRLDQRQERHLRPHVSVGIGDGVSLGPADMAGKW